MNKTSVFVVVLFLTLSLSLSTQAQTPEKLVITSSSSPPMSTKELDGFHDLLTIEIFRRLGFEITINHLTGERALINCNEGVDDGTYMRVSGVENKYPNLIPLEESMMNMDFVAFSRRQDIQISGWESLKPYNIGIVNGWKIFEWNIKGVVSLTRLKGGKQLFLFLDDGRADLVAFTRWPGLYLINNLSLKGVKVLEPPLATRKMFLYLHRKHQKIVPQASTALRKMKEDGTYQRLFDRSLGNLSKIR